jgi:D-beta-D-heptose 7-phosphate kinase/D-beta-D-heptose 1-phosphate adenosyltransferase
MEIFNNPKIIESNDLLKIRKENKNIVFCSGCYDILHSGHVYFFKQCKQFGDVLVVSLGSDKVVRELKGPNRPINPQNNRAYLLAGLESVDYVVVGEDEMLPGKIDFKDNIKRLMPDVLVVNVDDSAIKEKKSLCQELGIKLELVPRIVPDYLRPTSSTEIIKKIYDFLALN